MTTPFMRFGSPSASGSPGNRAELRLGAYVADQSDLIGSADANGPGISIATDGDLVWRSQGTVHVSLAKDLSETVGGNAYADVRGQDAVHAKGIAINGGTATQRSGPENDNIVINGHKSVSVSADKMEIVADRIEYHIAEGYSDWTAGLKKGATAAFMFYPLTSNTVYAAAVFGITLMSYELTIGTRWEPRVADWRIAALYTSMSFHKTANDLVNIKTKSIGQALLGAIVGTKAITMQNHAVSQDGRAIGSLTATATVHKGLAKQFVGTSTIDVTGVKVL